MVVGKDSIDYVTTSNKIIYDYTCVSHEINLNSLKLEHTFSRFTKQRLHIMTSELSPLVKMEYSNSI